MQFESGIPYQDAENAPSCDAPVEAALCRCFSVTKDAVKHAITRDNLRSVEAVTACTDAGGACTGCHVRIRKLLAETHNDPTLAIAPRRRGCP